MSAALRPSLDSAASDRLVSELEFIVLLTADLVVLLLDPPSSNFAPATPATLPTTAAVTATAARLRTNMTRSSLGGRSPGHLLEIERGMRCLREVAGVLGYQPTTLEAAPFCAVAEVQEGVPTAATACRKPEAGPAVGPRRVSEFAHRVLLLLCFLDISVGIEN